ncbi:hypothetical protein B0T14DRAFT_147701 [Immersiella caudata]|uniref:Uncharacterized protein n=1 Tax=Immersiella caudata TaxID=314043 RepID=A0AA40C281_9PEZI|nr:hypothetical protein B0T14DRAFT_147701 [Immersiella caudata]
MLGSGRIVECGCSRRQALPHHDFRLNFFLSGWCKRCRRCVSLRPSPDVVGELDRCSCCWLVRVSLRGRKQTWCKFAGAAGPAAAFKTVAPQKTPCLGANAHRRNLLFGHGSTVPRFPLRAVFISHAVSGPCRGCCDDAPGQGVFPAWGAHPGSSQPSANQRLADASAYLSWHLLLQPKARPELNVHILSASATFCFSLAPSATPDAHGVSSCTAARQKRHE